MAAFLAFEPRCGKRKEAMRFPHDLMAISHHGKGVDFITSIRAYYALPWESIAMRHLVTLLCLAVCMFSTQAAKAELPSNYRVVLFTENFPPFNMAVDGKNFAYDDKITGMNTSIVREMFRRAGIAYNLSLRFPWSRIYKLVTEKIDYGLFSVTLNDSRRAQFKWVGPLSSTRRVFVTSADSTLTLDNLDDARNYRIGSYKGASSGVFL